MKCMVELRIIYLEILLRARQHHHLLLHHSPHFDQARGQLHRQHFHHPLNHPMSQQVVQARCLQHHRRFDRA